MIFSRAPDSRDLAKSVNKIWTYTCKPDSGYEKIFPTAHAQCLFNLYGQTLSHRHVNGKLLRECGAVGLQGVLTDPILIERIQKTEICGVQFAIGGLSVFTDQCADNFVNQIVDAVKIWGHSVLLLRELLKSDKDPKRRCDRIESFLLQQLRNRQDDMELLHALVNLLESGCNVTEVQQIAGISQRKLHDLFDRYIGIRPKLYARITRFSSTLPRINENYHLSRVAIDRGYADQAHMTREFKRFANGSPRTTSLVDGEPNHAHIDADKIFKKNC